MSAVDSVITQALRIASEHAGDVAQYTSQAQTAAEGSVSFASPVAAVPNPTATEPSVYIPEKLDKTEISTEFDRIDQKLITRVATGIAEFLTAYFPIASDAYDEATNWLVNTITNGGTGIPEVIEDQIWQRGRDRINTDNSRAQAAATAEFAARGFSMPSGALAGRLQELRFDGLAKNAELSRDTAIKQIEIQIENIKFAVDKALEMRKAAMGAAVDYIRALMIGPEVASRYAFQIQDMQATLINAVSNFYNARLNRDELTIKAAMANNDIQLRAFDTSAHAFVGSLNARVQAAVGAAEAAGNTAAAALGSINAIASQSEEI